MPAHKKYKVKRGDCVSKIAHDNGLLWETLWDFQKQFKDEKGCIYYDQDNNKRDPNVIYPGEFIFIPQKEKKEESKPEENRHTFRLKGVPAKLRLMLKENDEPLKNIQYSLHIDGYHFDGRTSDKGRLECSIPPNAREGRLRIEIENKTTKIKEQHEFPIKLGYLDPLDTVEGVQARLKNLGFYFGVINGKLETRTIGALRSFQRKYGIVDTEKIIQDRQSNRIILDSDTKSRLKEQHGS